MIVRRIAVAGDSALIMASRFAPSCVLIYNRSDRAASWEMKSGRTEGAMK